MRSTTHLPIPAYLTALVEQVEETGYLLADGPEPRFQRFAGMSHRTGALQCAPRHPLAGPTGVTVGPMGSTIVARPGTVLVCLEVPHTYLTTAFVLAGVTELAGQSPIPRDVFSALTEALAGVAPVPTGTGDLTRAEVKQALFTMCYFGTGIKAKATVEDLRRLAAITGLTWVLPELAAEADKDGFNRRTHEFLNECTWQLLGSAHSKLAGLARAVALGMHEVYLEVDPQDVDRVKELVDGLTFEHLSIEVAVSTTATPIAG